MPGFIASLLVSPKDKVGAAVLTNSTAALLEPVALKLVAKTVEQAPVPPEPWRVEEPPPDDVAALLEDAELPEDVAALLDAFSEPAESALREEEAPAEAPEAPAAAAVDELVEAGSLDDLTSDRTQLDRELAQIASQSQVDQDLARLKAELGQGSEGEKKELEQ
jgi:hypothetical protein